VLAAEALEGLALEADGYYVDATFGRGGHTALILQALGREGRLLALDRDPQAIAAGRQRFAHEVRLTLLHASFADLATLVPANAHDRPCRGVLFDLVDEIRQVIATFGEERFARRVAQAIANVRRERALTRTAELAAVVAGAVRTREPGKHPATRTFQALRMHINDELGQLGRGLNGALAALTPGGRLAVISFHSLEDRAVKQFMQRHSQLDPALRHLPVVPPQVRPLLKLIGKKARASAAELQRNPRARSALLRVAERLA
jgi:16S rRNA (cytosine1402-N4)-methyltransferase